MSAGEAQEEEEEEEKDGEEEEDGEGKGMGDGGRRKVMSEAGIECMVSTIEHSLKNHLYLPS